MWAISNPSSPLPPFAQPAQATPPTTWSTHAGVVPSNVPTRGGRGGDLRPSLRARASCKQIAPHEGSKQASRPGRGPSQRSRRRGWQPCMYLPCGPLPTLQAKKARIKSVKSALSVPRPSRVGEEQRGFGTFRNRLSPRRGKGVRGVPRGPLTCLYAPRAHSLL